MKSVGQTGAGPGIVNVAATPLKSRDAAKLDPDQMLAALREILPNVRAVETAPGEWRVTASPTPRANEGMMSHYWGPFGATRETAIEDAFSKLTRPGITATIENAGYADRIEASWNGKGWDFKVGSAELAQLWAKGSSPSLSEQAKAMTGGVTTKHATPSFNTVGAVHAGEKPTTPALELLDRGFKADGMKGGYATALRRYAEALGELKGEVVARFGRTHPDLAEQIPAHGSFLRDLTSFAALMELHGLTKEPSIRDVTRKLYNRTGLALKHEADATSASDPARALDTYSIALMQFQRALDVDPNYGAAHYNTACTMWRGFADEGAALKALKNAIQDESFDYASHAIHKDTDWNALRGSRAFQRVVGIAPGA